MTQTCRQVARTSGSPKLPIQNPDETFTDNASTVVLRRDKVDPMAEPLEIITASEMDKMTPQQRADAVDASILHSWDEVDPAFRRRVEQRAAELAKTLGADA